MNATLPRPTTVPSPADARDTRPAVRESLSVAAVGDLAFHGHYHRRITSAGGWSPLTSMETLWRAADLRMGNLESPLTTIPRATPSKLTLRGTTEAGNVLRQAGFDVVSLANNHMMDFGGGGIEETKRHLWEAGVACLGAGRNEADAAEPMVLEVRGARVGLLAWCDVEQSSPLYATTDSSGVASWNEKQALSRIVALRSQVDWLIVHLHWGLEFAELPSPEQRASAKLLADLGVDLIVGHHPHVLQPAEVIDRTAVLYSLGNLTFSPLRWRGVNARGERFAARKRMPKLASRTGWCEVQLRKGEVPRIAFHPARLRRDLAVVPDDRQQRHASWQQLESELQLPDYQRRFQVELKRAEARNAWTGEWRSWLGRLELKLYEHGVLVGAGENG